MWSNFLLLVFLNFEILKLLVVTIDVLDDYDVNVVRC